MVKRQLHIDPLRETKPYLDRLQRDGVKLKYIFETHFKITDFVSGHVDLSKETGAPIVYGPNATCGLIVFLLQMVKNLSLETSKIKVLHTPGHTVESTTFLLSDENGKDPCYFLWRHFVYWRCRKTRFI